MLYRHNYWENKIKSKQFFINNWKKFYDKLQL